MSKARHAAKGGTKMTGGVKMPTPAPELVSGDPGVAAEAKKGAKRADGGVVGGKKSAMRLDRPGRKMGGRVGADTSPLSSAATTEKRSDTKQSGC
jgi:hypothetical protein